VVDWDRVTGDSSLILYGRVADDSARIASSAAGVFCEGGARCEYRAEKAFRIARPDIPSLSNLPVHPLEI
jgi:hypothetical protein